jgi:ketosteroid isomerase-like protein
MTVHPRHCLVITLFLVGVVASPGAAQASRPLPADSAGPSAPKRSATPMTNAASTGIPVDVDPEFVAFLHELERATAAMLNGDPTLWLGHVSRDPTLFTWSGGIRRGQDEVLRQYRNAAARMPPGAATVTFEYLQVLVSGDLATTVALEHPRRENPRPGSPRITRVTHIFRKEDGAWKLVHRHMDHLEEPQTTPP